MAQLKDTLISGSLRVTDILYANTAQLAILNAPTASNGTTYGPGSNGQMLLSNGTHAYWGTISGIVTGVKGNSESTYRTGNVNITATNIGLGNVENTKLSTWTGSNTIVTVGTITTGTWSGTAIAATKGGTGITTYTIGDILYCGTANSLSRLAGNTTTTRKFLRSVATTAGTATAPAWDTLTTDDIPAISITNKTTGTLPVTRGGTGIETSTNLNAVIIGNSTTANAAFQTVATKSGAFYATGDNAKPQFGTLPVAQGGTGNTTGTATYATTTASENTMYLVGVASGATTTLLHDVSITATKNVLVIDQLIITGGPTNSSFTSNGALSIISGSSLTFNSATNTAINFQKNNQTKWFFSDDGTNISPATTNEINLGIAGNSNAKRWKALYLGTADSYGDIHTPIYWNNGVPAPVTNIVQQESFSIVPSNNNTLEQVDALINNLNVTDNTKVVEIVVDSGIEYLNSPIEWDINTDENDHSIKKIQLTATVDGTVSGYILFIK